MEALLFLGQWLVFLILALIIFYVLVSFGASNFRR